MPRNPRAVFRVTALVLVFALALTLAGCGGGDNESAQQTETSSSQQASAPAPIKIGTLPTEDALPLWVAQDKGLFDKANLKVEIVTFQSAAERDIAFQSGSIDAFMGDLIAAASLESAGTDVRVATIMLGATPEQGRFGILASPKNGPKTMAEAAKAGVGTSSNTIQEYVLDGMMREAGVATDTVKKVEVKKVPERFAVLMGGKLAAAALPEPLLSLGEKQGAKLLADDTKGENLSQTVLVVSEKFEGSKGGAEAVDKLLNVWDEAVGVVNADPNSFRATLVDKARLPEPLKDSYEVQTYPTAQEPTQAEVDAVLAWMRGKQLLKKDVTFQDLTQR